jgi:hypothetical protein
MRIILSFVAFLMVLSVAAQPEFSLYRLNGNLPQANMLNPAFSPNSKVIIGLPVVSSIYLDVDNDGISFRDLFERTEDDSLKIDTLSLFSKLKPSNRTQFKESLQLFYFGLRGKKSYFSFGIHQVMETRLNYPGDILGWAIRGPGDYHYSGKPLDFGNFYGRSIAYSKISVNYARDITPKLRLGARFNYLLGIAAGESTKISGTLTMGIDSVSLNTDELQFQTAGIDFFDQSNLGASDYTDYFLKTKNKGMAIDLGATYAVTDQLTLSAAINDLGYISWEEYTRSYQVNPVNYTFRGFDLLDYLNQSGGQQFLDAEIDSLENLFTSTESTGNTFKTPLIGKFYAGANFRILRVNNFSALFYFDLFQKKFNPAVSLGYNLQLGRFLNTTIGITYQDGRINNIGAGLALKLTHLQFYVTSDRANSFVYPARASRADAHFGMNLVFGKPKKNNSAQKKKEEEKEPEPAPAEEPIEEPVKDSVVTAPPVVETPAEDTVKTVEEQVIPIPEPQQEITVDTVVQEPVIVPDTPAIVETASIPEEPRHETVKKGNHPDELPVSHYVIVGTFRLKENAQRYSNMLFDEGYANQFGFVTAKNVYYVYVHNSEALEQTRAIRDRFRKMNSFQFAESWVLTVE